MQNRNKNYLHVCGNSLKILVQTTLCFHIIIIRDICKAPTLRLKALNKHTHIMCIEMENVIKKKRKEKKISTRFHA